MSSTLSFVALCVAAVISLPLAGALFGYGLAWGWDLYGERRRDAAAEPVEPLALRELR